MLSSYNQPLLVFIFTNDKAGICHYNNVITDQLNVTQQVCGSEKLLAVMYIFTGGFSPQSKIIWLGPSQPDLYPVLKSLLFFAHLKKSKCHQI